MRAVVFLCAALVLPPACAPAEEPVSRELVELERLTFVPAAPYSLRPFFSFIPGPDFTIPEPLVMDLFEVTRRDVAYYRARGDLAAGQDWATRILSLAPRFFEEGRMDWPAFLSYEDAERLAELRGMRLPTTTEWIHVAVGRADRKYPWGRDQRSVANTIETNLRRPTPVGTFESGRARTFGCYDLVGNVWEWVEGNVVTYEDRPDLQHGERDMNPVRMDAEQRATAMGGAFNTPRKETYEWDHLQNLYRFHAVRRDRSAMSPSIGARMTAEAEAYLWEYAGSWGEGEAVRRRVIAVGRRWAEDATARTGLRTLLERMKRRPGSPPGIDWLLEGVQQAESGTGEAKT